MEKNILTQKQAFEKINERIETNDYNELLKKSKQRQNNFLSATGTAANEDNLKEEVNGLRDKIYPELKEIPYTFAINYYHRNKDKDFILHYLNSILGRSIKTALTFFNQPVYANLMLYSFKFKELLPMVGFNNEIEFKENKIVFQNFDELRIFNSSETKFISLLEMLAEQEGSLINIFEKKDDNKIIGEVIASDREDISAELSEKSFEYFRLDKEKESQEKWKEILNYLKVKGIDDQLREKLYKYISELEGDEEFENLHGIFKEQFGEILTEEYVKTKTGENDYDEGLKYYFWTFYFGTIRMILIKQDINNIYFLPIITGKTDKYIGGAIVLNSKYKLEYAHPVNKLKEIKNLLENRNADIEELYKISKKSSLDIEEIKNLLEKIKADTENLTKITKNDYVKSLDYQIDKQKLLQNFQLIFSGYVDDFQMQELNMIDLIKQANEIAVSVIANNISHNLGSHALSYIKNDLPQKVKDETYINNTAKFIGYLQERQEFISMFTMGVSPFYSSLNFKHFIEERFNKNKILLDYLAKSEGYDSEHIKIEFNYKEINYENFEVNLPGGHLGTQAFFSILEQKIRNIAKHQKIVGNKIVLDIEIEDQGGEFYEITIADSSGIAKEENFKNVENSLNSDFLRNIETSQKMGKGMQEMLIMAAWLRGVTPAQLVVGEYDDKEIISSEINENHISFDFKILKPKKVLIISNKDKPTDLPAYWDWKKPQEISSPQNHQIIVIDSNLETKEKNDVKVFLPVRQIEYNLEKDKTLKSFEDFYELWLKKLLKKDKIDQKIFIYDTPADIIDMQNNLNDEMKNKIILKKRMSAKENLETNIKNNGIIYFRHFYDENFDELYKNTESFIEETTGSNYSIFFVSLPKNRLWYLQAVESALSKIIIFDERLYDNYNKSEDNFYKFKNKNIAIVSIEEDKKDKKLKIFDLKKQAIGEITEEGEISMEALNYHLISIHQGLLDRIYDFLKNKNSDNFNLSKKKLMENIFNSINTYNNIIRIIVHSGRSILPQVPSGVAFVPYTALGNALRASKFSISNLLLSTNLKND